MTSGREIIYSTYNSQAWITAINHYEKGVANAEKEIRNMQAGRSGYDDKKGTFGKGFANPFGANLKPEDFERIKISIIGSKAEFLLRDLAQEIHQANNTIDQAFLAKHLIYKATDPTKNIILAFNPPRIKKLFDKIRDGRIKSDPQKAELKALKDELVKKTDPFQREVLKILTQFVAIVKQQINETEFQKEFKDMKMRLPGFDDFTLAISVFYLDPTVQKARRLVTLTTLFARIYPLALGEIEKIDQQGNLGPQVKRFLGLWGKLLTLAKDPYNRWAELDKDFGEKAKNLDKKAGHAPRNFMSLPEIGDDLCRAFAPFAKKAPQAAAAQIPPAAAPAVLIPAQAPVAQAPAALHAAVPAVQTPGQVAVPAAPAPAPVAAPAVQAPVQVLAPASPVQAPAQDKPVKLAAVPATPAAKEPPKKKGFFAFIARPFVWFGSLVKSFFAWLFGKR